MRVMTYSHDSYGLGHLRRNTTIAGALVGRDAQARVLCVTGSPVPEVFDLPPRCELLKLPSIGKDATGGYRSRRLPLTFDEITRLRSDLLSATWRAFRPDLLLVDHTPGGPGGELQPMLRQLRAESPRTRIVLGLREILDSPQRGRDELRRIGAVELIRSSYDDVLVYGERAVFDYAAEYELPSDVAGRLRYVGAVVPNAPSSQRRANGDGAVRNLLVTAGGGEDGYEVLQRTIATLRGPMRGRDLTAVLLAGPLMQGAAFDQLAGQVADDGRLTLLRSSHDIQTLMDRADLIVSMGGYNTIYEALARRVPLLTLPRRGPRQEQLERCRRLQALGALHLLEEDAAADPERFAAAIDAAVTAPDRIHSLSFDGARTTAEFCLGTRLDQSSCRATAL